MAEQQSTQQSIDCGCYRHTSDGVYKTFCSNDVQFKSEWQLVHSGACQCDGKRADECQEPDVEG